MSMSMDVSAADDGTDSSASDEELDGAEWQNGWRLRRFGRTSSVNSVPAKNGGQNSGHGGSVFAPGAVFAFSDDFGRPSQEARREEHGSNGTGRT
eukprot:CAMPEP_0206142384 /NCGR_PEP_ID=MMETSP1473-20131121/16661_1 /ASSEMBLY_ACC=CAM_ASM_001109 /TAXON_ID=1461547 /ORGANISM="Stichococcus sp, Strain RCC1054" /LENGTH=94 /DNA_ID=CAMNT_0053537363 /DNA_START=15 /DNA_END=299 /DNA_ORIENTATION=-